ncbi:MAG: hypothetical protein HDT27_04540 [Subdoligranulum sp.]|nr:hypothetical protein [Subdoligranulum sp.]
MEKTAQLSLKLKADSPFNQKMNVPKINIKQLFRMENGTKQKRPKEFSPGPVICFLYEKQ